MAGVIANRPELLVKLSAASLILSLATAKLYTYQMDILAELKLDAEYVEGLKNAYILSANEDIDLAEKLTEVSAEVDKMAFGWDEGNEPK